ncbi:MAG: glycoside hydrolase family 172 protein [Planctomycetota bacterium]|jgi:hypothetical protein
MIRSSLLLFLCSLLVGTASVNGQVTTGSLLREMTDLANLTQYPDPPYQTVQFSGYDRGSKGPYLPGWFANNDGFGGERVPGFLRVQKKPGADGVGTWVMVDVSGPGAIVRTWTARISGKIRLFLDGSEEPLYSGPAQAFLQRPFVAVGGDEKKRHGFSQRDAGYFPIPFARSCLMLWTGKLKDTHFYQIQVRRYEQGASVETFSRKALQTYATDIANAAGALTTRDRDRDKEAAPVAREKLRIDERLKQGERKQVLSYSKAPAAVGRLSLQLEGTDLARGLRGTVVRIYFDKSANPQVEAPLGDFFGAGPGVNPYDSLPMSVLPDGRMVSRWVMPFRQQVLVEVENWSGQDVLVAGEVDIRDYKWEAGRSMHFFGHWRVDHDLRGQGGKGAYDLPYLCAIGKGVYVGTTAMLMNPTAVPTEYGGWWGEGDEKIWVDSETFPSTFGTGSEDFFNYSWSVPDIFAHAYCAQPLTTGPGNRGYVTNLRWQILDAIPFEKNVFFFMEVYTHMKVEGLSYGRMSYYYAFPHVRNDHVPLTPTKVRIPPLPAWQPRAAFGARGAAFFQAEELQARCSGGKVRRVRQAICAGGSLLSWEGQASKDDLQLTVPVKAKGKYVVAAVFLRSPEALPQVRVLLDGQPIFKRDRPIDLRTSHRTMLRGTRGDRVFELTPGNHKITIVAVAGKEEGGRGNVGLDFLWLQKRK